MARKRDQDSVLLEASQKHGGFYSYAKAVYVDSKTKMVIVCPLHGDFLMNSNNHLAGKGCPVCGDLRTSKSRMKDTATFIEEVSLKYPGRYSFESTIYTAAREKLNITCLRHNRTFSITPDNLLRGKGCPLCGRESRVKTRKAMFDEDVQQNEAIFVSSAAAVHSHKYRYVGGYRTKESIVSMVCPKHGLFQQKATIHLLGCGCPGCAVYGFDSTREAHLYVLSGLHATKIGITNRAVKDRMRGINRDSPIQFEEYYSVKFELGRIALNIETTLLRELRSTHKQPTETFDGSTECFYDVDHDWLLSRIETLIKEHYDSRSEQPNQSTEIKDRRHQGYPATQ